MANTTTRPATMNTYKLTRVVTTPHASIHRWKRGDGEFVGPHFHDPVKANEWMQRNLASLPEPGEPA